MEKKARNALSIAKLLAEKAPNTFKKIFGGQSANEILDIHNQVRGPLAKGTLDKYWVKAPSNKIKLKRLVDWLDENVQPVEKKLSRNLPVAYETKPIANIKLPEADRVKKYYGQPLNMRNFAREAGIPLRSIVAYEPPNMQLLSTPHFSANPFTWGRLDPKTGLLEQHPNMWMNYLPGQGVIPANGITPQEILKEFGRVRWREAIPRQSSKLPQQAEFINFAHPPYSISDRIFGLNRIGRNLYNRGILSKLGQPINALESQLYETVLPKSVVLKPRGIYTPAQKGEPGAVPVGLVLRTMPDGTLYKGTGVMELELPNQYLPMFNTGKPSWLTANSGVATSYTPMFAPNGRRLRFYLDRLSDGTIIPPDSSGFIEHAKGDPMSNLYVKPVEADMNLVMNAANKIEQYASKPDITYTDPAYGKVMTNRALDDYYSGLTNY